MKPFETKLETYVELIIKFGINLQVGQTLVITASLSEVDFVRRLTRNAYKLGASYVHVDWIDEQIMASRYEYAQEASLAVVPNWKVQAYEEMAVEGAAFLYVLSPYRESFTEVSHTRLEIVSNAEAKALQNFNERLMTMKNSWTVVNVPTEEWAKRVFPFLEVLPGIEQLWESIFSITRVHEANPFASWEKHLQTLSSKAETLNHSHFSSLHFHAPGTSVKIDLPANHKWVNGVGVTQSGQRFICNIPTEEIYTTPLKLGVNGVIKSTKPLVVGDTHIENINLTFENGRIIDYSAEKGQEVLQSIIETDEGAQYVGEIAIVPHQSPISLKNITYYHTLYDENASCHLALGQAYSTGLNDDVSFADYEEVGINSSQIHLDIMIGSEELSIDGIDQGGNVQRIFEKGNWV